MKRTATTTRTLATIAVLLLLVIGSRIIGSPVPQSGSSGIFATSSDKTSSVAPVMNSAESEVSSAVNPQLSSVQSAGKAKSALNRRRSFPGSDSETKYVSRSRQIENGPVDRWIDEDVSRSSVVADLPDNSAAVADPMIILDLPPLQESGLASNRTIASGQTASANKRIRKVDAVNENDFQSRATPLESLDSQVGEMNSNQPLAASPLAATPLADLPRADSIEESVGDGEGGDVQNVALTQPAAEPPLFAQGPSGGSQGTTKYRLAEVPKVGDRWKSETPTFDQCAIQTETFNDDFSPDAIDPNLPYDPYANQQIYQGKTLNANQRPLLELGQPWYQLGQLSPGSSILGNHNNVNPQLVVFGDYRQAIASNTVNGDNVSQVAFEMNTFWSLFVTGTERFVTGVSPLDNGGGNTRWLLDEDRFEFEGDFDFDFGYLEGDLGAITGGLIGETLPFDLPFAAGLTPIFIQNGIWINDALEGVFATIPARNSPKLNISNMDITFAYIYDQINSAAFEGDNSAAKAYAMFLFIEALNGYFEIDYAFLEDRDVRDRSYHNIGLAFTRRFGRFISHSTRVIANAGQEVSSGSQTADGLLLLSENSLITRNPYTVIPYFNFFAGFDTPQSFAGDAELVNTGILFESDGMTGYPTLDGRAQDSFGYAIGLNLLAQDFSQQLILETAAVFRNDDSDLPGDQYGIGMRYQLPLTNSWIFRTDAMYGFFRSDDDDLGMRMELRKKF